MGQSSGVLLKGGGCISEVSFSRGFTVGGPAPKALILGGD